jgi:2-polyprenyl-6-methoxyphenol hydroxylase-like FAD-dependent oxidoreductase
MTGDSGVSIAVIGGGIGGLTAALCLQKIGIDVHVYEQARVLREVALVSMCHRTPHGLSTRWALARN